jgi:hypothetical protein
MSGAILLTMLTISLTRWLRPPVWRLVVAHSVALGLITLVAGYGMADGGEPRFGEALSGYLIPVLVWFGVDMWRLLHRSTTMSSEQGVDREDRVATSETPSKPLPRQLPVYRELSEATERYRSDLRRAEEEQYKDHRASTAEAELRIKAASDFVKSSGLDRALVTIWDEIEHWHAWSKRPDFDKYSVPGVTNVSGDVIETEKEEGGGEEDGARLANLRGTAASCRVRRRGVL